MGKCNTSGLLRECLDLVTRVEGDIGNTSYLREVFEDFGRGVGGRHSDSSMRR